jgi:hypothetical protein
MSEETYKYTQNGLKCIAVSEIRTDVWEVKMLYQFEEEYWEDDEDADQIESEQSTLYHGKLYDHPPLPIEHGQIAELKATIKELEDEEEKIRARIEVLERCKREFENRSSLIKGLGNLERLVTERPTHFLLIGNRDCLPSIKEMKDVYVVQDKIATLKMDPEREWNHQLFWVVKFGWSGDGVEAIPCFSYDEAKGHLCDRLRVAAKWDDLGWHYSEWKKEMEKIGISPSTQATQRFNEKQSREAEQKRKELEASIERQRKQLESLNPKE